MCSRTLASCGRPNGLSSILSGASGMSAEKMKMRRPHGVPLSTQAVDLFEELYELTSTGNSASPHSELRSGRLSENTLNAALRALGFGPEEMTRAPLSRS